MATRKRWVSLQFGVPGLVSLDWLKRGDLAFVPRYGLCGPTRSKLVARGQNRNWAGELVNGVAGAAARGSAARCFQPPCQKGAGCSP